MDDEKLRAFVRAWSEEDAPALEALDEAERVALMDLALTRGLLDEVRGELTEAGRAFLAEA